MAITEKDYSISFVRSVAMLCIFLCHILQSYNNVLGGWFDVGVQIFFFLSGYLYSNKIIINIKKFYIKNIFKLLNDYYIFFFIIVALLALKGNIPPIHDLVNALILKPSIPGTQHLWFIRFILFCYLFIPLFQKILNFIETKNKKYRPIAIIFSLFLIELFFSNILHITGAWFVCYFLGMLYPRIQKNKVANNCTIGLFIFLALLLSVLRIYVYYKLNLPYYSYRYIWCYQHVALGISIFFIAKYLYSKFQNIVNLKPILLLSDKYSYDFYIVHYSLIVGYFSIIPIVSNKISACISIFVCTCVFSTVLHFLSNKNFEYLWRLKWIKI